MLDKYEINLNKETEREKNLHVEITSPVDLYERCKLVINARNFHYDNFSKWMTYFYVATGALFIGYYSIGENLGSTFYRCFCQLWDISLAFFGIGRQKVITFGQSILYLL
ncbi:MAG: hypothetical protein LUG18_07175 [Candidatus Azobacteroides sp.]|nr:hypothetical protein [Candidatus Azobacteroides sp.]